MRRWNRVVTFALLGLLASCGEKPEEPLPVIVRENTRVLDASARALVSSFDLGTGSLVFSGTTPQLAALQPGDILASEPTPAAPYGFLRKVVSVTPQGAGLVLATTPGSLREAIVQGDLLAEGRLTPADLTAASASALTFGAPPDLAGGLGHTVPISVVLHDTDGNLSTTFDQLRLVGSFGFELGYKVAMGWKASYDPPFDVDVSTKFVGIVYLSETSSLGFEAGGPVQVSGDVPLGTYNFSPITFFVGPIPVVLVPRITLSATASGQIGTALSFGAIEGLVIEAGVSKDYGQGFKPVFGVTPSASAAGPNLTPAFPEPSFLVQGGVKARGSIRLYGLAGPYAELTASAQLQGGVGASPPWRIRGGLSGEVGVEVDLLFWEYDWSTTVAATSWDIAQATGNSTPIISKVTPKQGTTVQLGQPIDVGAIAGDVEDGWFCCTRSWVSDKEGSLGSEGPYGMKHVFQTPGSHTLTVTATDSGGAHASASTTIQVVNTPPVVTLVKPKAGFTWYRGVPLALLGWAADGNQPCSTLALSWTSSLGDAMPAASCTAPVQAVFQTNGARTLTLRAFDAQLATDAKSVSITIVDPVGNLPPDVTLLEPAPGASIADYQSFKVRALVFDPDDPALTYGLSVQNALGTKQIASGGIPGNATTPGGVELLVTLPASGNLLCGGSAPNTLELRVADGTGGHIVSATVPVTCSIVPK